MSSKRDRSNGNEPPKKRRRREKREKQTVLPREKTIISTFPRRFTPKSAEKVAQTLRRIKIWVIEQQKRLVKEEKLLNKKPKFISEFLKVTGKNSRTLKKVSKGCEYRCGGKGNWVTCPTCNRFSYHDDCLKNMFRVRKKQCPDLTNDVWKCVHCPP